MSGTFMKEIDGATAVFEDRNPHGFMVLEWNGIKWDYEHWGANFAHRTVEEAVEILQAHAQDAEND